MWKDAKVGFVLASNTLRRGNKKTTLFTIIVLALIFINFVFLPAMINGMQGIFVNTMTDYIYGSVTIEPLEDHTYITSADTLLKKIGSVTGVLAVTKRLGAGATITYKEKYVGSNIYGIIPEEEYQISKFHEVMREGDFLTEMSRDEIILGNYVSGEEGGPELLKGLGGVTTGTIVNVTYNNGVTKQYKVKGIFKGGSEVSDTVALVHFKELENILGVQGQDKASTIIVKTNSIGIEPQVKDELIYLGVKEKIETWQEKIKDILKDAMQIFSLLTISSRVVGMIIAVFVLFMMIYINTVNKRKQIGILKAIGITEQSIIYSRIFMSVFYAIGGIILGSIILFFLLFYFKENPIHFYETMSFSPVLVPSITIQALVSLLITSFFAGLIPAWLVTREPILKAIWGR